MRIALALILLVTACVERGISQTVSIADTLSKKERKQREAAAFAARNEVYRMTALGVGQTQVQDLRMSPLVYSGLGLYLDLSAFRYGTKSLRELRFTMGYSAANNQIGSSSLMHLPKLMLDYTLQRRVSIPEGKMYLGASVTNEGNARIYLPLGNNAFATDYQFSLNPSISFVKENIRNSRWSLWIRSNIGLAGLTIRYPRFTYEGIETQFLFAGWYRRWQFELAGVRAFRFEEHNRFYVAYQFELYRFNSPIDGHPISQYLNKIKVAFWLHRK